MSAFQRAGEVSQEQRGWVSGRCHLFAVEVGSVAVAVWAGASGGRAMPFPSAPEHLSLTLRPWEAGVPTLEEETEA